MQREKPGDLVNRIATATVCEPEQVLEIVRLALQALHKTAFCHEQNVTAALEQCSWVFGDEPKRHFRRSGDRNRPGIALVRIYG